MPNIYYLFTSLFKNGEFVYKDKHGYKGQLILPKSIGAETEYECAIEDLSVCPEDRNRLYSLSKKCDKISNTRLCDNQTLKRRNHDYKNLRDMTMKSVSLRHRIRKGE